MIENGNKSAFPIPFEGLTDGLTKREYFAGLAMQGMLANPELCAGWTVKNKDLALGVAALASVSMADALLAELEKGVEEREDERS